MKLQTKNKSSNRKMVHIHTETHSKIQLLSIYTGKPINEIVEILLEDALSRVELVESEDKE